MFGRLAVTSCARQGFVCVKLWFKWAFKVLAVQPAPREEGCRETLPPLPAKITNCRQKHAQLRHHPSPDPKVRIFPRNATGTNFTMNPTPALPMGLPRAPSIMEVRHRVTGIAANVE